MRRIMCSLWVLFVLVSCTSQTKKFEVAFEEGNLKEAETVLKDIEADNGDKLKQ